jgi:hypothetical protein
LKGLQKPSSTFPIAESIQRQKRSIAGLEAAGCGNSETAETLRALLVSMEKAHQLYTVDRERIRRRIADCASP